MSLPAKGKLLAKDDIIVIDKKAPPEYELEQAGEPQFQCNEISYGTGDAMFSCFIVAPHVVSVWRGTWGIMEFNPVLFPYAQIYVLGIVVHISFALIRSHLLTRSQNAWNEGRFGRWIYERLISRFYTYTFILSCLMHWRGGWGLFDAIVNAIVPLCNHESFRPVVIGALTSLLYLGLTMLRSSKNLLASPYFLVTDGKEPTYIFTTRYQNKLSVKSKLMQEVNTTIDCISYKLKEDKK